jgi:hypothetical protein
MKRKMKVVSGFDMFFADDIQIIDVEVKAPISIPQPLPILDNQNLQIFYNGHIYIASRNKDPESMFKVYTQEYSLEEIASPNQQEYKYFKNNAAQIKSLKEKFIERSLNGVDSIDGPIKGKINAQISNELIERIEKEYESLVTSDKSHKVPGAGNIQPNKDGSVFNQYMQQYNRTLVLEDNVYTLMTLLEYIELFKKSFEPGYYEKLQKKAKTGTPEEVAEYINQNSELVIREALPLVANKIWHSNRSAKMYLDGTYWIPQFTCKVSDLTKRYEKLLEHQIKIDAAKEYV